MTVRVPDDAEGPPVPPGGLVAAALDLWPEEFQVGWDPSSSRLFLPALENSRAGTRAAVRITIRGTGIGATVSGPIVATRRVGTPALPLGVFLGLDARGCAAARYLERVARGLPVDFNERDPRYAAAWRIWLRGEKVSAWATTSDVSQGGCSVQVLGARLSAGDSIEVRRPSFLGLLGPALPATICWASDDGWPTTRAGLSLGGLGRAARTWQTAVEQAARAGAARL